MAASARRGVLVELLTVLALDPDSDAAAGGWDRRAGYATEGEAARARREEDRRACALVGATPHWLPFGSVDYDRHGDEAEVTRAVTDALDGADLVLLPGSPLTHPDHRWLGSLLSQALPREKTALYAEQPYTLKEGGAPFVAFSAPSRDRLAKWRSIRAYRSQLPLLGLQGRLSPGPFKLAWAVERIAWPGGRDGPSQ